MMLVLSTACQKESPAIPNQQKEETMPPKESTWWKPIKGTSFDWDLDAINTGDSFSAAVVDVDAFTTTKEQVASLHAQGKKVIAYLSVGTIENDRPDANLLPKEVIGKVYPEWPKEKWLDIRDIDKLKPWLIARFDMARQKGFDAVEPDNLDSYTNKTGFPITENNTKAYCEYLIKLAHDKGLAIGQKNVPELTADLCKKFDWVLTEDAFKEGWQESVSAYIGQKKPVFAVEYTDKMSQSDFQKNVCPSALKLGYTAILKKRDLDKWTDNCN